MNKNTIGKISLMSLVLMIFSSIYGFSNAQNAYFQMGYASIIWYVLTALLFFAPSSLMFAEYGATRKRCPWGNLFLVAWVNW